MKADHMLAAIVVAAAVADMDSEERRTELKSR